MAVQSADRVTSWLLRPSSPVALARLRVAVFASVLVDLYLTKPWAYSDLPAGLVKHPAVGGGIITLVPLTWVPVGAVLLAVACVAAIVGWHTRLSCATATLLAVWVMGVPQLFGKVDHLHHLLWFGGLLALSPSGDALSVDAKGRARRQLSAVYGFPIRVAWLLVGLIYLSAGLPKVAHGLSWALSDNLRDQMWNSWFVTGFEPLMRFDHYPLVYQGAGLVTMAFEILFLPAVLWRPTRRLAVIAGLVFHLSTGLVLGIFFHTLIACYVMFLEPKRHETAVDDRQPGPAVVIFSFGLLVTLLAMTVNGGPTQAWPVATYPQFNPSGPYMTTYEVVADGEVIENPFNIPDHRWHHLLSATIGDGEATRALADALDVPSVEVVGTVVSTRPAG